MLAAVSVDAQQAPELSRLVVNIIVDQLRTDYMEAFAPLYGEGGFKRLMNEARYYADAQMPFIQADRASATASTSTGTVPFVNGIPSLSWLSRQTLQPVFCVDDARYKGLQTDERTSPTYLLTSTLADELKVATARRAMVYSIASERDMAVLMAGHVADGVFWLNDHNASWSSTSYYGDMPYWVTSHNDASPLASRLKKLEWEPVYEGAYESFHYFHANADAKAKPFNHKFKGDRRIREFKQSGIVSDEVVALVERCLESTAIGRDAVPDLLYVGLYAGGFNGQDVATAPAELQDTYVRLDSALARVINKVEKTVGRGRALFVVSSTGYSTVDAAADGYAQIGLTPSDFKMERASLLLNMYLSAIHGQAQYVTSTRDCHIYLDAKLIEQRQLRLADVLAHSEEFLAQMSGVRSVFTANELVLASGDNSIEALRHNRLVATRNGWAPSRSGDIVIEVLPGWRVECQNDRTYIEPGQAHTAYPLFFLGPNVAAERISEPVATTTIAPTLAACLRIRAPNGSTEAPLMLKD